MKIKLHGSDIARGVFQKLAPGLKSPLPAKGKTLQINVQLNVREKEGSPGEYEVVLENLPLQNLLKQAQREGVEKVIAMLETKRTVAFDSWFTDDSRKAWSWFNDWKPFK